MVNAESLAATLLAGAVNSLWLAPLILLAADGILRARPDLSPLLRYRILQIAWAVAAIAPWIPALELPRWSRTAHELPIVASGSITTVVSPEAVGGFVAPPWLAAVWGLGVVYGLFRVAVGCYGVVRSKQQAEPGPADLDALFARRFQELDLGRRFRTLFSAEAWAPLAAGWLRPAVLLPRDLPLELQPSDVERLWTHEAAHLEQWDDWARLLERTARAIYFFNPAFWIAGRRLDFEREAACDRWAANRLDDSRGMAEALARLLATRVEPHGLAPAAAGRPGDLERRIRMLTRQTLEISKGRRMLGGGAAFVLALGVLGLVVGAPRIALAQAPVPPAPPAAPAPAAPAVVAQAPNPPAPPAAPNPNPQPAAQPRPAPRPNPVVVPPTPPPPPHVHVDVEEEVERAMRFHEEIQPEVEAIAKLAEEISVEVNEMAMEEIHLRTAEIQAEVEAHVAPLASELASLALQMGGQDPDSPEFRGLEVQMEQLQNRLKEKESDLKQMEKRIQEAAAAMMRPDETRMRELERKMKEHELRIKEKRKQFDAKEKERKQKIKQL